MVKCMECGGEYRRIQARHLASSQCTGVIKTFEEYLERYPGVETIDPDVAASTAVTLENLIKKYGEIEGANRWQTYKNKQAESNSFEYKKKKHGWDQEQFDRFNKSRAVTVRNLIRKHGEEKGLEKWQQYCDRQSYTATKEYFIEEYGLELGTQKWDSWTKIKSDLAKSRFCGGTSKLEDERFEILLEVFPELDKEHRHRWFYFQDGTRRNVDYLDYHRKIAFEFNGNYWHMNPEIHEADEFNTKIQATAFEIWEKDNRLESELATNGIRLYSIWEKAWKENREKEIECIRRFLAQK